jgi:hypothetical protein
VRGVRFIDGGCLERLFPERLHIPLKSTAGVLFLVERCREDRFG